MHGFVTDDGIAVFRPVELMTLRGARAPRLRFAGAGTIWDPPTSRPRRDPRRRAPRVGARLRDRVGFRGAYTVDGILSADGWVANECNPRFGAGLQYTRAASPGLALDLLHHVVVAGEGPSVTAAALEDLVLDGRGCHPLGATWMPTTAATWTESETVPLRGDASGFRCSVTRGPPTRRCRTVRASWVASCGASSSLPAVPKGPSVAPRAVAALAFVDEYCGAGIGPLRAPVSVR